MIIYLDFETKSDVDLKKASIIKYIKDPSFSVLCLCYSIDDGDPVEIEGDFNYKDYITISDLLKQATIVVAHNAMFDISVWNFYITEKHEHIHKIDLNKVSDTMFFARYLRIPESLKEVALFLKSNELKDESGVNLIKEIKKHKDYYEIPDYLIKDLIKYCSQDVRVTREIYKKMLSSIPFNELLIMRETLKINFRGIPVNEDLIKNWSLAINEAKKGRAEELIKITNGVITTPNQTKRIKDFFNIEGDLQKRDCDKLLKTTPKDSLLYKVLQIRMLYNSSSMNRVLTALERTSNGRVHGALAYYKAHTGRWASSGLQVQNMPRSNTYEPFLNASLNGDIDYLNSLYELPKLIKEHFRQIISVKEGTIIAIDYSKIEYLVMRWLVRDKKAIKAYDEDIDFYKITASKIFNKDIQNINKVERWVGKIAELSLQYQIGADKFKAQILQENPYIAEFIPGDLDVFVRSTVDLWRADNDHIKNLWGLFKNTLTTCYNNPNEVLEYKIDPVASVFFRYSSQTLSLTVKLPSGRSLIYRNFKVIDGAKLCYTDFSMRGVEYFLYGGKIVNHLVQAIARDILANVLIQFPDLPIISLAHDEIVFEGGSADDFNKKVLIMPKWFNAQLKTEIKEGRYYK